MQKEISKNALAIRKLREIKGLDRKEASVLLEVGHKTIESFENGRSPLTKEKLTKYIARYGFTTEDFELCLNGKVSQVREKYLPKKIKVIDNNSLRRSYKRLIGKEAETLKVLRRLKGYSQYKASAFCGFHKSAIGHIENGRIELSEQKIIHILDSYGFTMYDFEYHMKSEKFVTDIQDECMSIIKGLSEEKLKAVHPLLQSFKS